MRSSTQGVRSSAWRRWYAPQLPWYARYGIAVAVVLVAGALHHLILPYPDISPFRLFILAIALAAWLGGIGGGLTATALSALLANYFFLPPTYSWSQERPELIATVLFGVEGGVVSVLSGLLRAKLSAVQAGQERLAEESRRRGEALALLEESQAQLQSTLDQLRDADRRKNDFLAMLSHELRNPLAPIRNSLYILDRAAPGGEPARRAKAVIDRQVGHLTRLIEDLLDVTRISRGKVLLQRELVDLNELARRTVDDHRGAFVEGGVELVMSPAPEAVWVNGDQARLVQLIGNLLQNAAKFTPRGGRTTVTVRADAARRLALVRVQDTGRGVPPDVLPHLFEPFTQADTTLDRALGGLGLGLALVKGVSELHGGSVEASSDGAGQGATFSITLPLEQETRPDSAPSHLEASPASRRVLVIEDNEDAAATLRAALQLRGHEVETARTGPEGIAKARSFGPEIVLCDIGLPDMDGYQVARRLTADPQLARCKLVAVTAYARPEDVAEARAAGFAAHLAKPVTMEALEMVLAGPVPERPAPP